MTWAAGLARGRKKRKPMSLARREAITGYIWVSPWIIGFLIFTLAPVVASFLLSLTTYSILSPPKLVGLKNYITAFGGEDRQFWGSLGRTLYYTGVTIPFGVAGSLFAAILLNQRIKARALYRTFYFLPSLTPSVALAILWMWIFQPDVGLVNHLLWKVGIQGPNWFSSKEWAIPAFILMSLWAGIGGGRMIIFLAGLQGIPIELYEAADIDGAGRWTKFVHVTLPMLSPTVLFNLVIGMIGALKIFTTAYIATGGGPAYATWFYVLNLYYHAFRYWHMGYASALAWIFFFIVMVLTFLQLRWARGWVYYESEVAR